MTSGEGGETFGLLTLYVVVVAVVVVVFAFGIYISYSPRFGKIRVTFAKVGGKI